MNRHFSLELASIFGLCLLILPIRTRAQIDTYFQPRVIAGASAASFRISLDSFEEVYESRWGKSYGGFVGVRAFSAHYVLFKYGTFRQVGKTGVDRETGLDLRQGFWHEKWYHIGLRIHPPVTRKLHSYYGFGLALFDVKEHDSITVFKNSKSNDEGLGSGLYLEVGLQYFVMRRAAGFLEMQISSGGVHGKTGFEAMSVGGFRFAVGISVLPF